MGLATDRDGRWEFLTSENPSRIAEKLLILPTQQMTHVSVRCFAATSQLMAGVPRTELSVGRYVKCREPSGSLVLVVFLVNSGNFLLNNSLHIVEV